MSMHEPGALVWRKSSFSAGSGDCVEVAWRKSSFSAGNGDCVEVAWQKSSHSAGNGACVEVGWRTSSFSAGSGNCVEVGSAPPALLVRDSKNPGGPVLSFAQAFSRNSALSSLTRSATMRARPGCSASSGEAATSD